MLTIAPVVVVDCVIVVVVVVVVIVVAVVVVIKIVPVALLVDAALDNCCILWNLIVIECPVACGLSGDGAEWCALHYEL